MLETFIDGLRDREIAIKIMDDSVSDVDVAVREAERLSGNRESANVSRDPRDQTADVLKVSSNRNSPNISSQPNDSHHNAEFQQINCRHDPEMFQLQADAPSPSQFNNSYYNNNANMNSHVGSSNHVPARYVLYPRNSNRSNSHPYSY